VIAELLLIVITVALGTLVYSFASTAFGGFGSGFSNLVQNAGEQLQENLVVEQVYFFNTNNTVYQVSGPSCNAAATTDQQCGGVMFVRNVGAYPILLETVYLGNISASGALSTVASSTLHPDCYSNNMTQGSVCFALWNGAKYLNDFLPMTSSNEIMPGHVATIRFVLPVDTTGDALCATNTPPTWCAVVHGGTVYAFTLVTSRGNEFVAYEKA
jgi:hypothetical protein